MTEITVLTVPETKEDKDISYKYEKIVEDRNKSIAKMFKVEPKDITLKLFLSTGAMHAILDPNGDHMGVFAGYAEGSDAIMLAHPVAMKGLFNDIDKETLILVDYSLVKFYLCQIYYPERTDFKTYHNHISEHLAALTSGKFQDSIVDFDIKMYDSSKRFTKDQEVRMFFYIMFKKSGIDFIYDNLEIIMKDLDVKKSVFEIYKKTFDELLGDYKREIADYEKQIRIRKNR